MAMYGIVCLNDHSLVSLKEKCCTIINIKIQSQQKKSLELIIVVVLLLFSHSHPKANAIKVLAKLLNYKRSVMPVCQCGHNQHAVEKDSLEPGHKN